MRSLSLVYFGTFMICFVACFGGKQNNNAPVTSGVSKDVTSDVFKKKKGKSKKEVVFKIANGAESAGLDLGLISGSVEHRIIQSLVEGLVYHDPVSSDIVLGVAEKKTISQDGLVYTFNLRSGLKWSDGKPLTAHDFVYGYKRMLDPKTGSRYSDMLYPIAGAKAFSLGEGSSDAVQVRALDDVTLELRLERPTAYFLSSMGHFTFFPHPRHVIEKYGDEWSKAENYVGNGAFKIKKWVKNSFLEMERNPHFYAADEVKIDRVIYYPTDDATTAYNMFKKNEVDWNHGMYPPAVVDEVFARSDIEVSSIFGDTRYEFNVKRKPFDDVRVRKAFALALDRKELVNSVLRNGNVALGGLVPPASALDYQFVRKTKTELFNIEQARKLLADAGYPNGVNFPKITLSYNVNDSNRTVAEWTQQQWKNNLGIDVALTNEEWKTFLKNRQAHKFDIARSGWYGDFLDPVTFLDLYLSDNSMNDSQYSNPEFDRLMEKASKSLDGKARLIILREAEEILLEDQAMLPLYVTSKVNLIDTKKWGGWHSNPLGKHLLRFVYPK